MGEHEFDLRGTLGLLRRQLRLILVMLAVGLAAAGLAVFVLKPVYTASALVMVDPSRKNLLDPETQAGTTSSESARVDSEVELVRSETTLLSAVQTLDLVNDPEFGVSLGLRDRLLAFLRIADPRLPTGEEALQSIVDRLRDAVSVQRRGLTFLISIQARSSSPETAARLANAIAEAYIREQLEFKVQATLASRDIIQGRIADASTAVARSEDAFDQFIDGNIRTITAETGRTDLLSLQQRLQELNQSRNTGMATVLSAETSLASRDWQSIAQSLQSDALAALERDKRALEQSLLDTVEGSQAAIDLRARLDAIDDQLEETATAELTSLRSSVSAAQSEATDLRAQLRSSVLSASLPAETLTSIYELQQSAELARVQYQTLLARANDLDAQAYLQVADSRIVSQATRPISPSFPNPPLILALAGFASLALGIGLAVLVENYVGGFTSEEQLQSVLRVRQAVSVPRQKEPGAGSVADAVANSPLSAYAEAVRRIRVGVDLAARRRPARDDAEPGSEKGRGMVVMVTSAAPAEGKSTLALSLARAYALAGKSTLLVDCDLRKPSIHRQLGVEPSTGLLDYLISHGRSTSPSEVVVEDKLSGAHVVVGSRRSDVATDQLVSGATFERLIAAAVEGFEIVVLDTPPIGPVVDGVYLAPLADVVVFVVRWAGTSQQDARAAISAVSDAKKDDTEVIAVLNQQAGSHAAYRGKYAGYYTED